MIECLSLPSVCYTPPGLLQPLEVPERRWEHVSLDFVGPLPPTAKGHDMLLVMVDKLSKMVHLAPCLTSITAKQTAELFLREVVRHHGFPSAII